MRDLEGIWGLGGKAGFGGLAGVSNHARMLTPLIRKRDTTHRRSMTGGIMSPALRHFQGQVG